MRLSLPLLVLLACAVPASWVCPVFRAEDVDPSDPGGLPATAVLSCWEVLITPTPVTDETMMEYADWDYMVSERFSMIPTGEPGGILLCVDEGVVPEGTRELLSVTVDGIELSPCSVLARPFFPADLVPGTDTLYILRSDPWHPCYGTYVLDDLESYRTNFPTDREFREAVPETARFYASLCEVATNGAPFDVEVVYRVTGWSWLSGGEPLRFGLLEPGLWAGEVERASFLIDLSAVPDRESWTIRFMDEEYPGDRVLRLHVEDFDITDVSVYPVLCVTPPGLSGY